MPSDGFARTAFVSSFWYRYEFSAYVRHTHIRSSLDSTGSPQLLFIRLFFSHAEIMRRTNDPSRNSLSAWPNYLRAWSTFAIYFHSNFFISFLHFFSLKSLKFQTTCNICFFYKPFVFQNKVAKWKEFTMVTNWKYFTFHRN